MVGFDTSSSDGVRILCIKKLASFGMKMIAGLKSRYLYCRVLWLLV